MQPTEQTEPQTSQTSENLQLESEAVAAKPSHLPLSDTANAAWQILKNTFINHSRSLGILEKSLIQGKIIKK